MELGEKVMTEKFVIEVWDLYRAPLCPTCKHPRASRSRYRGAADTILQALTKINWKRKRLRVRHFYSRRLKRWVIQFITGNGYDC